MNEKMYDPMKDGAVNAIRIFYDKDGCTPMAELAFAFGGTQIICWTCPNEREPFIKGINGYTLIFDERKKQDFSFFVKDKS